MRTWAKRTVLRASKWLGLFHLARQLTRNGLRILCYHGFELDDEAQFRPNLFISPRKFRERIATVLRHRFPVLGLDEALTHLGNGTLPPASTVITIDDGFYSVLAKAADVLREKRVPATVYVTTYYALKQRPIFRLVVQYLFWRTRHRTLIIRDRIWAKDRAVDLTNSGESARVYWEIIEFGETRCTDEQRDNISRELAALLDVDYRHIQESRSLSLMTVDEIKQLSDLGFDIQLHTHRHRLSTDDKQAAQTEVIDNRTVLERIVGRPLQHLCYPSGIWSRDQWPWLEELGVRSATTCVPGLNYTDTPALGLTRFLDSQNISAIEFEAELYGYLELMRRIRTRLACWLRRQPST
jgi:peptidoglycan/xylan/chitin deacetylase (PgdA/CDA1 family)